MSLFSTPIHQKIGANKNQIDIFCIQETKLIGKDKTFNFNGFTIIRRDRDTCKGAESNRGGGLLIGIHQSIPFNEILVDIRDNDLDPIEFITIEINLTSRKKIRITNLYIPPIRINEPIT